ncbi:unnamed protein product, partial [marine sediment metagenome]
MLRTRIITALILAPIVIGILIYAPKPLMGLFFLLCATACLLETLSFMLPAFENRLAGKHVDTIVTKASGETHTKIFAPETRRPMLITVGLAWCMFLLMIFGGAEGAFGSLVAGILATIMVGCFLADDVQLGAARSISMVFSLAYSVLPWVAVWQIYLMAPHSRYILLVVIIVWCGDTGGYFGGRMLGGKVFGDRKLAPKISPKKTWEGAVCGLLLSIVV